jgi:hypothetical protein
MPLIMEEHGNKHCRFSLFFLKKKKPSGVRVVAATQQEIIVSRGAGQAGFCLAFSFFLSYNNFYDFLT